MDTAVSSAVTQTAAALGQLSACSLPSIGQFFLVAAVGLLGSPVMQNLIEGLIYKWQPSIFVKMLLPTVFSTIVGFLLHLVGVDAKTATEAALALCGATHVFNNTSWAADLEKKLPGAAAQVSAIEASLKEKAAKLGAFALAFLLLGATLQASDTATQPTAVRGWMTSPNLYAQGALYALNDDHSLTPTSESVAGFNYAVYYGTWSQDTKGNMRYDPLFYFAPAGLGVSAGTGQTWAVYTVAAGYKYFGVSASWNVGSGKVPLFGLQATIPLVDIIPGLVVDVSGVVKENFPGAGI